MSRPTLDDIARRVGVSRGLVSLALRDLPGAGEETRRAIQVAAEELGYVPNAAARNLARQRTGAIGVMLGDLHNAYFADVVDGLSAPFEDVGYHLMMVSGRHQPVAERSMLELFRSYHVEGAVLIGPQLEDESIERFGSQLPTVLVGRELRSGGVDVIVNDDRRGAALAVKHLYDLGHRDIAHLDGGDGPGAPQRRRGYLDTMRKLGLSRRCQLAGGGYTAAHASAGTDELIADRAPTAIFAASDVMAIVALQRLASAGLSVPGDVSVIGYDNTSLIDQLRLGLTSIDQPRQMMGHQAATLLHERLAGRTLAVKHVVRPTLVRRTSTAPPPAR